MGIKEQKDKKKDAASDIKRERFGLAYRGVGLHRRLSFRLIDWFSLNIVKEIRLAEPLVWMTCLFLVGIALYLAAPSEPHLMTIVLLLTGVSVLLWRWRFEGLRFYGIGAIFALMGGFTIATFHTHWSDPSIIDRKYSVSLEGTVQNYEKRADGSKRLVIGDIALKSTREGLVMPKRIRVRVLAKGFTAKPGDRLAFRAEIGPPPGLVMPSGYDFARDMFFKGIGATGFVFGTPKIVPARQSGSMLFLSSTTKWRAAISGHISNAFEANGQAQFQGVAAALLVGERGNIEPEIREAFVVSGLAHLLAISGLHMALVMTFIIFATRGVLALNVRWSLHYSIRNIAIYAGLGTGFIYFLLSGGSVSATRAFIMVSIMALAMLFGRRAISVRNIALACLLILLLSPFALIGPGFQMSFAATLCLVAFASYWLGRSTLNAGNITIPSWLLLNAKRYFLGLIITSLLAGISTGLFAAFHFHRIAPLGLVANLIGVPIFASLVMPFGFMGLALMPFGYEALPFKVMGLGIDIIVQVADQIGTYTGAYAATGALNSKAFLLLSAALILLCVMKSQLRLLLIPVFALGFWALPVTSRPHVLIAEDGKTVAVRTNGDELVVSGARAGRFEQKVWRAGLGLHKDQKPSDKINKPFCDDFGCVFQFQDKIIAHVKHPSGFYEDCRRADVVISQFSAPRYCEQSALVIDRYRLKAGGAHSVHIKKTHGVKNKSADEIFIVKSSIPAIKRPWHNHYQSKNR
ncbi:MAG: ComEC/Rec2 family competence protein [Hyphomicrobiales bacterium]